MPMIKRRGAIQSNGQRGDRPTCSTLLNYFSPLQKASILSLCFFYKNTAYLVPGYPGAKL